MSNLTKAIQNTSIQQPAYCDYLSKLHKNSGIKLENYQDLYDGVVMYNILMQLRSFEQEQQKHCLIDQPQGFIQALTNLKTVMRIIHSYWVRVIHKQLHTKDKQIDLIKIVRNRDCQEIQKMLLLVVRTLFYSSEKQRYIEKMIETSPTTQEYFMKIVQETMRSAQQEDNQQQIHVNKSHIEYNQQSCKSDKIYDRLLQLQHQNQSLLQVLGQLYQEQKQTNHHIKQLQSQLLHKQQQIKTITWRLTQVDLNKSYNQTKYEEQCHFNMNETHKQENQSNLKLIRQFEQRQKCFIEEITNLRLQLNEIHKIHDQLKVENVQTLNKNTQFIRQSSNRLMILTQDLNKITKQNIFCKQQLKRINQQLYVKNEIILSLQTKSTQQEEQLFMRQQLIQTLEYKLKQVQQNQLSRDDSLSSLRETSSTIKTQCIQSLNDNNNNHKSSSLVKVNSMSHTLSVIKLRKQVQTLRQQLYQYKQLNSQLSSKVQKLQIHQSENKKLVQMISHMQKYRGQQNQILVKTLYKMRMKMLGEEVTKNKYKNKNNIGLNDRHPLSEIDQNRNM